jgi:hypothetical protein
MAELTEDQAKALSKALEQARQTGEASVFTAPDGSEAYAYPARRGITWGVNFGGANWRVARGVERISQD